MSATDGTARLGLAGLCLALLTAGAAWAQAQPPRPANPPSPPPAAPAPAATEIDVKLFDKAEVDLSKGCSVALWQANRDPETDKFAYVMVELLGKDDARQPARIKIGSQVLPLRRIAIGGKSAGYKLWEYQLNRFDADNQFVVLQLKLEDSPGEVVDMEGSLTVIQPGKVPARISVKGAAGCNTPAAPPPRAATAAPAPAPAPPALPRLNAYTVKRNLVPPAVLAQARTKYGCQNEVMRTDLQGMQLSEEAAIWEIPCERFAYQAHSVFALVYLPSPADNLTFLSFKGPKGKERPSEPFHLMSPKWNAAQRTVTGVSLGRGSGDCGVMERYRVTESAAFELVEYREKEKCDGVATSPEQYPLVFRAR